MKKTILILVLMLSWLVGSNYLSGNFVLADWWTRPSAIPSQPSFDRDFIPTTVAHPTLAPTVRPENPTATPVQPTAGPTVKPTGSPVGGTPDGSGGSSSTDDPCGPGKSFVGPHCGWSPDTSSGGTSGGSSNNSSSARVGGPQVLGLSNTSGSDVNVSDIILLTGVLCLLLYLKSKIELDTKTI